MNWGRYWILLFSTSFATCVHELNGNVYVKLFAFEFVLFCILIVGPIRNNCHFLRFNIFDLLVSGMFMIYLYWFTGKMDILNLTVVFLYYILFIYIRFSWVQDCIQYLFKYAPFIITIHIFICFFQSVNILPNFHSYFTIGSTFGNPDILASYLSVLLPCCYTSKLRKTLKLIILVFSFVLFFYIQARTAIIATLIPLLILLKNKIRINKIILLVGTSLAFIACLFILVIWHPQSFLGRIYIWIVSLYMMFTRPFGWGVHAFEKHYMIQQAKFTIANPKIASFLNYDVVASPYNEFLNIGVSLGIFALLMYVVAVVLLLKLLIKNKSVLLYPFLAFQVLSLSFFPFRIIPLNVIYITLCCYAINMYAPFTVQIELKHLAIIKKITAFFILLLFIVSLYCFNKWRIATRNIENYESIEKVESYYKNIYPLLRDNGRFLASYANYKYLIGEEDSAYVLLKKAENCYTSVSLFQLLARMYEEEHNIPKSKEMLELSTKMTSNDFESIYYYVDFLYRHNYFEEIVKTVSVLIQHVESSDRKMTPREEYFYGEILGIMNANQNPDDI